MSQADHAATAGRLADLAGIPNSGRDATSPLLAIAAFALNAEQPILVLFDPPATERTESGPARLLVVTRSRAIESTATLPGDWYSSFLRQHRPADLAVTVRSLRQFDRLTVTGGTWRHNEALTATDILYGTSAALTGPPGTDPLILWSHERQPTSRNGQADMLLAGLQQIATILGSRGQESAS